WGIDYLKCDWCPSRRSPEPAFDSQSVASVDSIREAYERMRKALDKTGRDVFLTANTYGVGDPAYWASAAGANAWLTTGRVLDQWVVVSQAGFGRGYGSSASGPGAWADMGWLMVGKMASRNPRFTRLTPAEQMTQVSLWSVYGSPLILSCDLR